MALVKDGNSTRRMHGLMEWYGKVARAMKVGGALRPVCGRQLGVVLSIVTESNVCWEVMNHTGFGGGVVKWDWVRVDAVYSQLCVFSCKRKLN